MAEDGVPLPGKATDRGRAASDNRLFVNGCLWVIRSGAMWHHLPGRYGPWERAYNRFRRWAHAGVWEQVFAVMPAGRKDPYRMIGSSIVRVHQLPATGRGVKKTRLWGEAVEDWPPKPICPRTVGGGRCGFCPPAARRQIARRLSHCLKGKRQGLCLPTKATAPIPSYASYGGS